ncbi:hypothetical protein EJB05_10029, partial [Eragrostis curvula]
MSTGGGSEHRVRMPVLGAGKSQGAKPEKQLNRFVRVVAFIERAGNALGTLAFGWATVILLGGYPTELSEDKDFWYTTTIVFLEAEVQPQQQTGLSFVLSYQSTLMDPEEALWDGALILIPAAVTRVVLSLLRLVPQDYGQDAKKHETINLAPSLNIFYVMVLIQGILYLMACVLEIFSFISRRRLARRCGLGDQRGVEFISLYYAYALGQCMEGNVLAPKKISLDSFAMYCLNSDTPKMQLYGIRIMDSLLQRELTRNRLVISELAKGIRVVTIPGTMQLVSSLLDASSKPEIRSALLDANDDDDEQEKRQDKVYKTFEESSEKQSVCYIGLNREHQDELIAASSRRRRHLQRLASSRQSRSSRLRLGASSLNTTAFLCFHTCHKQRSVNVSLCSAGVDTGHRRHHGVRADKSGSGSTLIAFQNVCTKGHPNRIWNVSSDCVEQSSHLSSSTMFFACSNIQEQGNDPVVDVDDYPREKQDPPRAGDTSNLLETQARSNQQVGNNDQNSCFLKCRKWLSRLRSSTLEKPLTDHDHLPLPELGMSILHGLAYDYDNCREISRAAGLIPKIIGFTSYKNDRTTNEVQQKILMESSLKLLRRLSNTSGEIGITLRHRMSEHPFLLRNLAEILNDSSSSEEVRKLVAGIIRNLAIDTSASLEIGRIEGVIIRLMDAFLSRDAPSSTSSDQFLQKVAGQALAILTMESVDNCAYILTGPRNVVEELTSLIYRGKHKYVAARLLQNLLVHIQLEFSESDLRKLCKALDKVLENIMDPGADEAELEVLIGLSSQICRVIPGDFARLLETRHHKEMFVKRLVNALNANRNPTVHCPGVRRMIIEQAISLMKYSSHYATVFNQYNMMEALSMVEQTPSRVERYKIFLGDVGFMEQRNPSPILWLKQVN